MIFAVDIDGTFAADPKCFKEIIDAIKKHNHEVIYITARPETDRSLIQPILYGDMPLLMSGHKWKKQYAEKNGYFVDIWIDDSCTEIVEAPPNKNREVE